MGIVNFNKSISRGKSFYITNHEDIKKEIRKPKTSRSKQKDNKKIDMVMLGKHVRGNPMATCNREDARSIKHEV